MGETTRFKTNRLSLLENEYRLEWDLKSNKAELFKPLDDPKEKQSRQNRTRHSQSNENSCGRFAGDLGSQRRWYCQTTQILCSFWRASQKITSKKGDSFQVPYDAQITFRSIRDPSKSVGPMQSVGKKSPAEDSPLQTLSVKSQSSIELDDTTRSLEQLGYIQSEE